ncbi:MAG: NADH-quinone oxidoreductase subunit NuoE family protein [Planctomycetota bacterium]|jgi:NADH-quinone oxidoreductase subunit E
MDVQEAASVDLKGLDEILASIPDAGPNDLIPILQKIQTAYGYLPPDVLMAVSERTGIAASRIYGVATFYEQFHLEPHGRHTVRCCRGTACHVKGGRDMIRAIRRILGVEEGETTEDMEFTFETVACLGACALAPVMLVDGVYYGKMTSRKVNFVLDGVGTGGKETA